MPEMSASCFAWSMAEIASQERVGAPGFQSVTWSPTVAAFSRFWAIQEPSGGVAATPCGPMPEGAGVKRSSTVIVVMGPAGV